VNERAYQDEDKYHEYISTFIVEVEGKLGAVVYEKGKKGRGVRVVGWLKEERHLGGDKKSPPGIVIMADHVEFRPGLEDESRKPVQKEVQTKRRVQGKANGKA